MTWSLLNAHMADKVKKLLDGIEARNEGRPDFTPAISRESAEGVIHGVIWALSARSSDFSGAYAWEAIWRSLGIDVFQSKLVRLAPEQPAAGEEN